MSKILLRCNQLFLRNNQPNSAATHAFLLAAFMLVFVFSNTAQVALSEKPDARQIEDLKKQGLINGTEDFMKPQASPASQTSYRISPQTPQTQSTLCNCWIPRDASWSVVPFDGSPCSGCPGVPPDYRNDDSYTTTPIALPFNFCFYGTNVSSVYINNNGNISIGGAVSVWTSTGFPYNGFPMVAPFWGDVDTRGPLSGLVYYKLTSTHLIVQWEQVGYFSSHDDLLNTFQLIITDGNDTIIPTGKNVNFCFQDMQWTTGDASGGSGGYGGTPTTAGINQGNGVDYIQLGLYDHDGIDWDGPIGNNDGVSSLDNQSFFFNCCFSNSNVPPIIKSVAVCDTLNLCVGDTVLIDADYLSPEPAQLTTASVNTNGMTGITVLQQTTANIAHIQIEIIASAGNVGYNTIYLTGTDNGAPSQTTTTPIVISIQPSPTAAATFLPPSPVAPNTVVTFNNTSSGLFSWWDFGDGSPNTTTRNPTHAWTTPGTYTITCVTMNPSGCTDTLYLTIVVNPCVIANIINANTACQGDPVTFTYGGTAGPNAIYSWNFGTGTVVSGSGAGPYQVIWNTSGNFNVTLSVTDSGCTSPLANVNVTINPNPVATISGTPSLCVGANNNITFTGTAIASATYNWDFGNGTVNSGSGQGPYSISWNTSGNDSIGLIVSQNGCSDTAGFLVQINPTPTSTFTVPPSVCVGDALTVTYTGSGSSSATYTWNFGGGTVLSGSGAGPYSISWSASGATSISLTVTENGCTSTPTNLPVTVNAIPIASITGSPALCVGDQNIISFNGTAGTGATYTWNFGNATVVSGSGAGPYTLTWNSQGNDLLSVIVSENGCSDTTTFAVAISPIPNSTFTLPNTVCVGNPVQITYTGNAPASANYAWNFGGGTVVSGSGQGPYTITWSAAGNPQVSLTVTVGSCISPTTNLSIAVSAAPVASFTATTTLCAGDQNTVTFTGTTGGSANWNWNFGTASVVSGSGQGPYQLQYNTAGNYNIDLIVNENGCADTATVAVLVNPIPSSTFSLPPAVCVGDPVAITYTGTGTGSANCTWGWSGGTVQSGSGQGPYSIIWNTPGNPVVSLTVSENNCTSPQTQQAILIAPYPAANAGIDAVVCSGTSVPVGFAPEAGVMYQWSPVLDLLDPLASSTSVATNNSSLATVTTTYTLTASNSTGCVTTDQVTVTVDPVPVVNFAIPAGQCFENNLFSFDAGGNLIPGTQYSWDFGVNAFPSTSNQQTPPNVIYSAPGTYPVTLNAIFQNCPAIPFAGQAIVYISPQASFLPAIFEGCEPLEVPLLNFSTGDNNTYQWTYSDGFGDDIEAPSHIFEHPGVYSISVTATTQNGCVDDSTMTNVIQVYPVPVAAFVPEPEVTTIWEPFINFENLTVNGSLYTWDFGDSTASEEFRPSHEYTDTGTYHVILYVINSYGCMDTITGIVRVEYGYTFYIPNAFTPNDDGVNEFFQGYGTSVSEYDMQIFDRWGTRIYSTNDYFRPWNGKIGNTAVPSDVYVYNIRVKDYKGEVHKYVGRVTVVH